jgi:hypothetical protein
MDGWIGDGFFLAWLVCLALIKKMLLGSVARFVLFCWYDGTMSGWGMWDVGGWGNKGC